MPFSPNQQFQKNKLKSLQAQQQTGSRINVNNCSPFFDIFRKRASASASQTGRKGSLTVEAAFLLSFFLLSVNILFYFFHLMEFQVELQFAMERNVREEAMKQTESSVGVFMAERAVKEEISGEETGISLGETGLCFVRNQEEESEFLDVTAIFHAGPAVKLPGLMDGLYIQRSRRRLWMGQDSINKDGAEEDGEEEYVYITQNGTVCHKRRDCTYLKLSVRQISSDSLSALRNTDGGKYKPCERCTKGSGMPQSVYITDSGDRYHSTGNCSSLNRWVMKVTAEEAGGMPLCSRCGG